MEPNKQNASFGQRWANSRPTKTVVFWCCMATAIATMIVGFGWGGWVTGATALSMAQVAGDDAVAKRLAPMCVIRAGQDPGREKKLTEVQGMDSWQRGDYVKKQGWATMPGEPEPDGRVADECVKLLMVAKK